MITQAVNSTEFFEELQDLMQGLSRRISALEHYTNMCESSSCRCLIIPVPVQEDIGEDKCQLTQ